MIHFGDISKIKGNEVPIVDIVTGGSPCQDLSIAGRRAGLDGERSGLFMEQIRLIKEMREHDRANRGADVDIRFLRPRFMVWENVPGAFSSNQGEDFRVVLEEICRVAYKAASVPMPEDRKWSTSGCIMGDWWSVAWRVHDSQFWGVPQRRKRISLVADFGGGAAPKILFERESLHGTSEPSEQEREETSEDIGASSNPSSFTLKIRGGVEFDKNGNKGGKGALVQVEKSATLRATQEQTLIHFSEPLCIGNGQTNNNSMAPIANALDTMHDQQAIIYSIGHDVRSARFTEDEITDPLTATDYKDPIKINCQQSTNESVVRRLTPMECERLQGYPDGWTDIGDWIDSKGKKHRNADSPRYKALGNSIALPFWEWMARRIVDQYDRETTMASLFDGIGGFPLVFQRCGCKPIWASEIEEFPMAVTKIRFKEEEQQ